MPTVNAVCFDLDGTLCVGVQDRDALLSQAFMDADVDPLFDGTDVAAVDRSALPPAETELEFFSGLFRAGARRAGVDPGRPEVEAVAEAYLDRYDPTAVAFRDGARPALEAATNRHPVALVTNGSQSTQRAKLERLGIADAFDATIYCGLRSDIETKPHPMGLRIALNELDVPPDRALYVGNSVSTDVTAARAAGMGSVWVPHGRPTTRPPPEPTHRIGSLAEIPRVLD